MRKAGQIGASLDATITLHADLATQSALAESAEELRFFFITSDVALAPLDGRPATAEKVELEEGEVYVSSAVTDWAKCIRCWQHRADVGHDPAHPEICGRCVENVAGPGEDRRWF
jgi:isoleucyl-tRNA synthetase